MFVNRKSKLKASPKIQIFTFFGQMIPTLASINHPVVEVGVLTKQPGMFPVETAVNWRSGIKERHRLFLRSEYFKKFNQSAVRSSVVVQTREQGKSGKKGGCLNALINWMSECAKNRKRIRGAHSGSRNARRGPISRQSGGEVSCEWRKKKLAGRCWN